MKSYNIYTYPNNIEQSVEKAAEYIYKTEYNRYIDYLNKLMETILDATGILVLDSHIPFTSMQRDAIQHFIYDKENHGFFCEKREYTGEEYDHDGSSDILYYIYLRFYKVAKL